MPGRPILRILAAATALFFAPVVMSLGACVSRPPQVSNLQPRVSAATASASSRADSVEVDADTFVHDNHGNSRSPWSISKLIFYHGFLWALGPEDSGPAADEWVGTIDLQTGAPHEQLRRERIVDIHRTLDDQLWVLSQLGSESHVWNRVNGGFELLFRFHKTTDPMALSSWRNRPVVLSGDKIHWLDEASQPHESTLTRPLSVGARRGFSVAVSHSGDFYAGTGRIGEFGGTLLRIPIVTGRVEVVVVDGTNQISRTCGHHLFLGCDPVHAVIPDPENRDCVLAGNGWNFSQTDAQIFRACSTRTEVLTIAGTSPSSEAVSAKKSKIYRSYRNSSRGTRCPESDDFWLESLSGVFDLSPTKTGYWMQTGTSLYFVRAGKAFPFERSSLEIEAGLCVGWYPAERGSETQDENKNEPPTQKWKRILPLAPFSLDDPKVTIQAEGAPALRQRASDFIISSIPTY